MSNVNFITLRSVLRASTDNFDKHRAEHELQYGHGQYTEQLFKTH